MIFFFSFSLSLAALVWNRLKSPHSSSDEWCSCFWETLLITKPNMNHVACERVKRRRTLPRIYADEISASDTILSAPLSSFLTHARWCLCGVCWSDPVFHLKSNGAAELLSFCYIIRRWRPGSKRKYFEKAVLLAQMFIYSILFSLCSSLAGNTRSRSEHNLAVTSWRFIEYYHSLGLSH